MLAQTGVPTVEDIASITPNGERLKKGPIAVLECFQNIPCNPCVDACSRKAIRMESDINQCPQLDDSLCNGCGICLVHCPGLSVFIIDQSYSDTEAVIKIPFEFYPLPAIGQCVDAVNRAGQVIGSAKVLKVQTTNNKTNILWLAVPKELSMEVRNIAWRKEGEDE
ncbi:MAG TPA: 4Fe-4S ferredoxin [Methylomusa anaerophila]|uniref:4Fe-4S ferredoxin-type domain-containing protein n=1 Tax=Methylomusa anaerophila TaxID=1930071 RepID=A0A348APK1_9FIRM|nr:4Fe-4S ferredoxin [Methylomusa anaerophila]BBB92999.1 hypothetical protein MAMMFC1_03708 [Methylomusa anaerophila]HML87168.1 4Fe-4S ferredoxin [Methylomusa anaerophila]